VAYTPASEWKKSKTLEPSDLQLPSGNVALVRAPGLEKFVELGFIPNSLLDIMTKLLDANSGKQNAAKVKMEESKFARDILSDSSKLSDITAMANKVTVYCVEKPNVVHRPMKEIEVEEEEELVLRLVADEEAMKEMLDKAGDQGLIWVDEVDLDDKMFIMNFACGGTRAVREFRGELASVVGTSQTGRKVVKKTKRTGGPKKKNQLKKK
jgi:hypothetical protein